MWTSMDGSSAERKVLHVSHADHFLPWPWKSLYPDIKEFTKERTGVVCGDPGSSLSPPKHQKLTVRDPESHGANRKPAGCSSL